MSRDTVRRAIEARRPEELVFTVRRLLTSSGVENARLSQVRDGGVYMQAEFLALETIEYLQPSPLVKPSPELDEFIAGLARPGGRLIDVIEQVTEAVRSRLVYEKKVTTARTPLTR